MLTTSILVRVVSRREEAKRIEARKHTIRCDDARIVAARNEGTVRSMAKRQLLQALAERSVPPAAYGTVCRELTLSRPSRNRRRDMSPGP